MPIRRQTPASRWPSRTTLWPQPRRWPSPLPRIIAWTREQTPHQVMRQLQAVGVPAGVVQTAEDLWRDVHLRARDYMVTLAHPELGMVEHPGVMIRLQSTPGHIQRLAGPLGADNDAVFRGLLGLAPEELSRLVKAGVIA